ncbi:hypothetical protein BKA66DRAFT_316434 [Pyrenochaeta sp. MPI-SDFR-AT-0127]|nr:hypothetical protein BKA66DRAFT_316434 [Pyrenochaeta sp. MPI-SDFR-AT-0127]
MARLTDLPSNLISCIFECLSRREYYALTQTCHALNTEATSYLYRDIRITATKSQSCARKLALLLRALFERPRLASKVATFGLFGPQYCWGKYDSWPENSEHLTSVKLWGFHKSAEEQSHLTPDMFFHFVDDDMHLSQAELRERNKDALATLVITRLMNLKKIELGDGFIRHSIFLPQILKRIDYLFPALEHIVFGDRQPGRNSTVSYTDLDLIRPVFCSSTVETFECSMAQPWKFHWNEAAAPCNTSLTSLHLFRTNITRSTLQQLLSVTPNLKSFHYEQEISFNSSAPRAPSLDPYLELDGLNSALACVRNTLEECQLILRLGPGSTSASQYDPSGVPFPAIEGTLSILKDMPKLKKVEVPMIMFFGWYRRSSARLEEVLPLNLTDITFRDDFVPFCYWSRPSSRERRIGQIGKYIKNRASQAPHLATLKVRLINAKESLKDAVRDLSSSTREEGLEAMVLQGKKSETYCWQFEHAKVKSSRPGLESRADSVLHEDGFVLKKAHFA